MIHSKTMETPQTQPIIEDDESGDAGKAGSSSLSISLFLPIPFEVESIDSIESEEGSHSDKSFYYAYHKTDWHGQSVQWGRWVYDSRNQTLKHSISHRIIYLTRINSSNKLLKVISSLMIQPNGDSEQFYQLATGILQHRHGASWDDVWKDPTQVFKNEKIRPKTVNHGNQK